MSSSGICNCGVWWKLVNRSDYNISFELIDSLSIIYIIIINSAQSIIKDGGGAVGVTVKVREPVNNLSEGLYYGLVCLWSQKLISPLAT